MTFVLGIVVEELVLGYHFRYGESHRALGCLIDTAGDLATGHQLLDDDLRTFGKGSLDGRLNLVRGFHLGATETTAAHIALDETR